MKALSKFFMAACLMTIVAFVGCGLKPANRRSPKSPKSETPNAEEPQNARKEDPGSDNARKATPEDLNPEATGDNPPPPPTKQESGSGEKEGGLDIPKE